MKTTNGVLQVQGKFENWLILLKYKFSNWSNSIERLFFTHRVNQCTESEPKYDLHNDYLRFKTMDQLLTAKIYEFWIWAWPYAWFSRQCHEIKNIFLICNNNIYLCIYTDLKENGAFNRTSIWVKTVYLVIGLRL